MVVEVVVAPGRADGVTVLLPLLEAMALPTAQGGWTITSLLSLPPPQAKSRANLLRIILRLPSLNRVP